MIGNKGSAAINASRRPPSRKQIAARDTAAFTLAELQDAPRRSKQAEKDYQNKLRRKLCSVHKYRGKFGTVCWRCGHVREVERTEGPVTGGSLVALEAKLREL